MSKILADFIKKIKTNLSEKSLLDNNPELWPQKWKQIEHKEYKRFRNFSLLINQNLQENNFIEILQKRSSENSNQEVKINFEILSNIIYFAAGEKNNSSKRFYPSAGARYPLELYIISSQDLDEIKKGVYHFNVKNNSLEFMWDIPVGILNKLIVSEEKSDATIFLVTTALLDRVSRKYGDLAYKYIFLETGAILQNILLLATTFRISNSICNYDDFVLENLLEVDGENEIITGLVTLGFSGKL